MSDAGANDPRSGEDPPSDGADASTDAQLAERLAALTEDFTSRLRRAENPSIEEYARANPTLADDIRQLFPALLLIEQAADDDPAANVAPPGERVGAMIGRYRLLERLGVGGFGVVFMAEQQQPVRRKVAVKVIKPGTDTAQVIARFEAERQALALMDHENIAKVFDAGATESGRPYFVMELVHGVPITEYCDQNQLSPTERLRLFGKVCAAVQHAHTKGVIHRDIKPSNVLVTLHDGSAVPKVIDFGVAKATGQEQLTERTLFTQFAQIVGTPLYMSPEQAEMSGLDIDTRSDVYSLGVLLYELLTGTTPFDMDRLKKAAVDEVRRIIREEEPPTPSTRISRLGDKLATVSAHCRTDPKRLGQLVRGELDWMVMKCLEKDRARRYETANALALDVQRYLSDEPVQACPPSSSYRFRKFARRNKRSVIGACVLALALVGGIIGTSWGLWHAERARRGEAERAEGERNARQIAQTRLEQIEKGYAILSSVFIDLDPTAVETEGKPLRALLGERLDRATQELQGEAVGDPVAVATLQMQLARSQLALGYADKAVALYSRARATFTEKLGPENPDTLSSMGNLAAAYRAAGRLDLSLPLFEETLKLMEAKLGPNQPDTLRCMGLLAHAYQSAGKFDRAVSLFEEALKRWRAGPEVEHRGTISAMEDLATAYHDANRLDKAMPLYEEALSLHKSKLGPEHPRTLITMHNFARAVRSAGQLDRAVQLNEEALAISRRTLGPEHPNTVMTMAQLAGAYRAVGKLDLALPMMEDALKLCRARLGGEHPTTLTRMKNLAVTYSDMGRFDEALVLLTEALRIERVKLGPQHPDTITCMSILGATYLQVGKLDEALPMLEETLKLQEVTRGPEHSVTLHNKTNLAVAYRDAGKLDQAIALHQQALAVQERTLGPDHPETLKGMHNLGTTYWTAGRLDQSIAQLEKTLRLSTTKLGKDHSSTLRTIDELAVSYRDAGRVEEAVSLLEDVYERSKALKPLPAALDRVGIDLAATYERCGALAKAESLSRELVERARQRFGADHRQTAASLAALGATLLQLQRYADAEPVLAECLSIRQRTEGDAWTTFMTRSLLGHALLGQHKYVEAEPLLLAGYEGMQVRELRIPVPAKNLRLGQALDRLVQFYQAQGNKDEAAKWRERWESHQRAVVKPADH